MPNQIRSSFQVNSFLLFFIIHSSQIGVGILTFQRMVAKEAGYDSWIGVIAASLMAHLCLFFIFRMLKYEHQDILQIHLFVFGKWLGRLFTFLFIIQFVWVGLVVLRDYVTIMQVWLFPSLPTWVPSLIILVLLYYTIAGGFHVMVGMCFFKVIFTFLIMIPVLYTLSYAQVGNLSFIPSHTVSELWNVSKSMSLNFSGFETVLVYYPFIKEGQKSKSYAYLGNAATAFLYLFAALMCFLFYSEKQLSTLIWPFLTMASNLEFSTVQRFEIVIVSSWVLVIIPSVIQYLWCASRLVKNIFKVKQKYPLIFFMIIIVALSHIIDDSQEYALMRDWNGKFTFYLNYIYIPVLFLVYMFMRKIKLSSQSS